MLDLTLAIAHHLLIFGLFGVLAAELISVRAGMTVETVTRMSRVDLWYGVLAGLIIVYYAVREAHHILTSHDLDG